MQAGHPSPALWFQDDLLSWFWSHLQPGVGNNLLSASEIAQFSLCSQRRYLCLAMNFSFHLVATKTLRSFSQELLPHYGVNPVVSGSWDSSFLHLDDSIPNPDTSQDLSLSVFPGAAFVPSDLWCLPASHHYLL